MGFMNRIKQKSIQDVKDDFFNEAEAVFTICGLPIEEYSSEYIKKIRNSISGLLSPSSPMGILNEEWERVLKTNLSFSRHKYLEKSWDRYDKLLENRTRHLKIDKEDLTGFIDNFRLASLQTNGNYLYPDKDIDLQSCYQNIDFDKKWRIYIFDDSIKEHGGDTTRLRTFYICYEISRALLQTRNDAIKIVNDKEKPARKTKSDLAEVYTIFRRTSLSVGLALYFCKTIFGDNIDDIVKFISDDKILDVNEGLKYSGKVKALAKDIKGWLKIQKKGSLEYFEVYEWFFGIKHEWE